METIADYTSNPGYMKTLYELTGQQETFMAVIGDSSREPKINLNGIGEVEVGHLRNYAEIVEQAYDIRMRLIAYWKIVKMRLVDVLALHILRSVKILVEEELEAELASEIVGGPRLAGFERLLEESPSTAGKRERLQKSIELLKESKEVVTKIMDRITLASD